MKPAPPVMRTLAMACGRGLHPLCFVAKFTYERVIIKKRRWSSWEQGGDGHAHQCDTKMANPSILQRW